MFVRFSLINRGFFFFSCGMTAGELQNPETAQSKRANNFARGIHARVH